MRLKIFKQRCEGWKVSSSLRPTPYVFSSRGFTLLAGPLSPGMFDFRKCLNLKVLLEEPFHELDVDALEELVVVQLVDAMLPRREPKKLL